MRKSISLGVPVLAAVLCAGSSLAYAGDLAEKAHDKAYNKARFEAADTDGDGVLSRQEAAASMRDFEGRSGRERFDAADTNGDGALSMDEAKAFKRGEQEGLDKAAKGAQDRRYDRERFEEADSDGDGYISRAEANASKTMSEVFGGRRFEMADTNQDGKLSMKEAKQQKAKEREAF